LKVTQLQWVYLFVVIVDMPAGDKNNTSTRPSQFFVTKLHWLQALLFSKQHAVDF